MVIRANVGDTVQINFENKLNRRASIHVQGLSYNVLTSDGAKVGLNPDTTTDRSIRYVWRADREGVFLFSDLADPRGNEQGTNIHGLFGAIIVEAAGSSWCDPMTGKPMGSGLFADIYAHCGMRHRQRNALCASNRYKGTRTEQGRILL